jgi:hypothetical protein
MISNYNKLISFHSFNLCISSGGGGGEGSFPSGGWGGEYPIWGEGGRGVSHLKGKGVGDYPIWGGGGRGVSHLKGEGEVGVGVAVGVGVGEHPTQGWKMGSHSHQSGKRGIFLNELLEGEFPSGDGRRQGCGRRGEFFIIIV